MVLTSDQSNMKTAGRRIAEAIISLIAVAALRDQAQSGSAILKLL
jgi:hypothetical protein